MWPSSDALSRLIDHWKCRVSAQDHGEPCHTEGANLLAETVMTSMLRREALVAALIIGRLCTGGAVGGLIDTFAILGLGLSPLAALRRRHAVRVLLRFHGRVRSWIIRRGVLAILAHSPTTDGGSALGECPRSKYQTRE